MPRSSGFLGILDVSPQAAKHIFSKKEGKLLAPVYTADPPQRVVSRFLAKAAIEQLGSRLAAYPAYIDDMAVEPQFDPIRNQCVPNTFNVRRHSRSELSARSIARFAWVEHPLALTEPARLTA